MVVVGGLDGPRASGYEVVGRNDAGEVGDGVIGEAVGCGGSPSSLLVGDGD